MGLMKKLTSAVVASSLVLGTMGMAFAAPTADQQAAGYARMSELNLVTGNVMPDGSVSADLDGTLTRAQILTIIARAFGQEQNAALLNGLESFSDVPGGQWYSGYVAVAKQLASTKGFSVGYPDGTFQPSKEVTNIEALTFVLKFLGVQTGTGDNWVADTIAAAQAAGVITDADVATYLDAPNAPATRGAAFALADQIFASYNKLPGGKTVYTSYVDTTAPALTVSKPAAPSLEAASYAVNGIAEKGTKVFVNGTEVTLNADGSFTYEAALVAGENTITVNATDVAGNVATETITITRVAGAADKIEIADLEVAAGSETELAFKVLDASGLELADAAAEVEAVLSEGIGSYEDGVFTAAEKVANGTITLTLGDLTATANVKVVAGAPVSVAAETGSVAPGEAVKLVAVDKHGNAVEGATFSETESAAFIEGDKFTATKAGEYEVTATIGETSVTGKIAVFGDAEALKIVVPETVVANGETEYEIKVEVVDENGALVRDYDDEVELSGDLFSGSKVVRAKDGVATFKFDAPEEDGDYDVYAELVEDADIDAEITVKAVAQKATSIELDTDEFFGLGWRALSFSGEVNILDQAGEAMITSDEYEITLKVSGPAYFNDDEDRTIKEWVDEEGYEFELVAEDFDTEGTVTITATADGLKEAKAEVKAVYAGAPKNLVINKSATGTPSAGSTYRIGLTDRNGVPVYPADDHEVKLTFANQDYDGSWGHESDELVNEFAAGTKEQVVYFDEDSPYVYVKITNPKPTKDVSVRATSSGLSGTSATIEYKATAAAYFKIDAATRVGTDINPAEFTINVLPDTAKELVYQLVDAGGTPVKKSVKVEFAADGVTVNGKKSLSTYTDAEGKVKVKIVLPYFERSGNVTVAADHNGDGKVEEVETELTVVEAYSSAKTITIDRIANSNEFEITVLDDQRRELGVKASPGGPVPAVDLRWKLDRPDGDTDESGTLVASDWDTTNKVWVLSTGVLNTEGNYTLTVWAEGSIYNAKKSVEFTVLPEAEAVAFSGMKITDTTLDLTNVRDNVSKSVTIELRDGSGKPAEAKMDWTVTVELYGDNPGQVLDGTWVAPDGIDDGVFNVDAEETSKTVKLRGITSYGTVKFKITVTIGGDDYELLVNLED